MKSIIIIFALFAVAFGCRWAPLPPFRTAILNSKNTSSPFAVATVISEYVPNVSEKPGPFEDVTLPAATYTVLSEGRLGTVNVTSFTRDPGACGITLTVGTKYVLPLKKDRSPTRLSFCDAFRNYDPLPADDKTFV